MKQKKLNPKTIERTVALCYVRQSFTRDRTDTDSPDRQRANIEAKCTQMGWTPEWYEDAEGHKSGRDEKNRPGWLALKERLNDPDIVALVGNDLSRLHRKGWRVGDLIDYLDQYGVRLVLAAPGREIDLSTAMGRLFVQFTAILDEWYAADISQRAKDQIAHRKARGLTVGMPPFGTVRGDDGHLKPSPDGAWLLSNGTFVAGDAASAPEEGAIWRAYYATAEHLLNLYATGEYGLERIAYTLNQQGLPFRDRTGTPRPINRDDVRRVVANWPEYGGIIFERSAKTRPAYEERNVDEIPFNTERAVFSLHLLRSIAQIRQARSVKPADHGANFETRFYALAGITYCAQCEQLATEQNNPKLRTALSGLAGNGIRRYRHKPGVTCGCHNRSVPCEVFEEDFGRLVKLLTVKQEAFDFMTELAIQVRKMQNNDSHEKDFEEERREAIAVCRRRIDAAVHLYKDGEIEREEYLRIRETNEREIIHWEARTTRSEELAVELALCMEAVEKLARLWDISSDEDRQGLVRSLFSSIVYDLDSRRIVDFRLKPWADEWVTVRAALYAGELAVEDKPKSPEVGDQGMYTEMPHRGFEPLF